MSTSMNKVRNCDRYAIPAVEHRIRACRSGSVLAVSFLCTVCKAGKLELDRYVWIHKSICWATGAQWSAKEAGKLAVSEQANA